MERTFSIRKNPFGNFGHPFKKSRISIRGDKINLSIYIPFDSVWHSVCSFLIICVLAVFLLKTLGLSFQFFELPESSQYVNALLSI